ncbi:MAG: hypothetical protein WD852_08750 [Methyloceanibacter sp.]
MDIDERIGGLLIVTAVVLGAGSIFGLIALQIYTFLADGVWHMLTLADLAFKMGYDPISIVDPHQTWEWVGVGRILSWAFYTASAAVGIIAVCFLIGLIGASFYQ